MGAASAAENHSLWGCTRTEYVCTDDQVPVSMCVDVFAYFDLTTTDKFANDSADGPVDATYAHVGSVAAFANFISNNRALDDVDYRVLTISSNFRLPIVREFMLGLGFVDASAESVAALLRQRTSVVVVVGGAAEALDARPKTHDLTLNRRFGFVRLAIEHGADLLPVYSFGENDVYKQVLPNPPGSWIRKAQEYLMGIFGYSIPFVRGAAPWFFMPLRRPVTTVVGKPFSVPHVPRPSLELVKSVHKRYIGELKELFEEYRPLFSNSAHENPIAIVDSLRNRDIRRLHSHFSASKL